MTIFHTPFSSRVLYKKDMVRAVYIIRDLRDVVASYYHYAKTDDYRRAMDPACYYESVDSFYFDYFLPRIVPRYDWTNHATEYVERGVPVVRYEGLCDNTEKELKRLFSRWGVEIPDEKVRQAVQNNEIDRLKASGKKTWREIPTTHFRKGGYGKYSETLTETILEDIHTRFADYLRRWGYPLS